MRRLWRKFKLWARHTFKHKQDVESPADIHERPVHEETPKPQVAYTVTADDIRSRTVFYYEALYHSMIIKEDKVALVRKAADTIIKHSSAYIEAEIMTGVPWQLIGALHYMECNCDMTCQLLNGERWYKRTRLVPKRKGPWKSWLDSTVFAFKHDQLKSTRLGETLRYAERYNGMGYVRKGINSPYLWSYSNHYTKGKYVADGKYSPYAVSKQVGVAPILKELHYDE